nr:MAG TPA: hypothetical protein [Bacteriophage sp.]
MPKHWLHKMDLNLPEELSLLVNSILEVLKEKAL